MAKGLVDCDRDTIKVVTDFLGNHAYLFVASVSKPWRNAWGKQPTVTSRRWAIQSLSCLDWAKACGLEIWDSPCLFAAEEGRLDVLRHAVALGYSREGMPICEWAAGGGHLEVVKWCRANAYPWGMSSLRAAEGGHLDVLKWCVANGCPITFEGRSFMHMPMIYWPRGHYRGKHLFHEERFLAVSGAAAKGGHLETVIWCRDQGYSLLEETSYMAAEGGHLDVLMWLRANGRPWHSMTMRGAAKAGALEILEWCKTNGCPWDSSAIVVAAEGGHLEAVKWCVANNPQDDSNYVMALAEAAKRGHLEVIQWMRANGCPWGGQVCYMAACGNHLEVLKWCVANGCPWGFPKAFIARAFNGSVSMMMWAALTGCPWLSAISDFHAICRHAARGGNLEVLEWCTKYRPLLSFAVSWAAALEGQVHILEWLRASGRLLCDSVDTSLCATAARSGSLETVKWCRANSFPWDSSTSEAAMESGNLELLQWCRTNGCPWSTNTLEMAIFPGAIEVLAWCHANGCPLDASLIRKCFWKEHDEMNEWCRDHLPCEPDEDALMSLYIR